MRLSKVQKILLFILVFALCTAIISGCAKSKGSPDSLTITLSDIQESGDGEKEFTFDFDNNYKNRISFGWGTCDLIVTTTEDTFSKPMDTLDFIKIGRCSKTFKFPECPGDIINISFSDLRLLNNNGLPDGTIKDVTVFDPEKRINGTTVNFSAFRGFNISAFIVITAWISIITFVLILMIRRNRRRKQLQIAYDSNEKNKTDVKYYSPPTTEGYNGQTYTSICIKCGAAIDDNSQFCQFCGSSQTKRLVRAFTRDSMSEDEFIARVNQWLKENKQAANVTGEFHIDERIGLLVNSGKLSTFKIEYECLNGDNTNQYAIENINDFTLYKKSKEEVLEIWKQSNPTATIINVSGITHQRGYASSLLLGGIGAANRTQLYIFYKFPREQ